ncbi:PfkB family carbohydrate kinase [Aestuariivirga sp.]|uniref:PfkB family carbohydrate kinase n=1 Tax=Aestuariivirga sp. TaxID=2650926 RepID=UPI0025B9E30E|nr:PfkB family carbohydrate kinase [Aestuariivirga sp.]MCA3555464.1 bifunctional hydroxymethylpyrimidine kinase/phosphomethylpyrimidine kinase [Aestuariivirga sp.]
MIDVAVAGSLHLDIVVEAPRLPGRDETLIGSSWRYKCGGKGGNQAAAAARCGARTAFGGRTGQDDFGELLRANLVAAGVDIAHVGIDAAHGSGMSIAVSEAGGEYGAVVVSGANLAIDADRVARDWAQLLAAKVLLLQNEIPEAVNLAAARAAKAQGARVVLNAAPARKMTAEFLALVDLLVVNRVEAAMLSGEDDMGTALAALHSPSRDVVLTGGGDGSMLMRRDGVRADIPALPVKLISSHGAGDCFCGALAARLAAGDGIEAACRFATQAAGKFVSTAQTGHG